MARVRRGRPVHGVLLLDKPSGRSSNFFLQRAKFFYHAQKAGHTGSLDPLASGLLPLCFGDATKISSYLLEADKHYLAEAKLGEKTDTGDAEGEVIKTRSVPDVSDDLWNKIIAQFTGDIEQIPPMYSALKHQGKSLYKLARAGKEVDRAPRQVTIHGLQTVSREADRFTIDVSCSKGTYIRTLVEDIGEALGCGAHLTALRRTGVDPYREPKMIAFDELQEMAERGDQVALDDLLMPIASALSHWPTIYITAEQEEELRFGRTVPVDQKASDGLLLVLNDHERAVALAEVNNQGILAPKKVFNP